MRSIWKGSISFGLVSIPIKVVGATENHSVSFHQVHATDGGRIRYRKVCELEEREVPSQEIIKGFQAADGTTVQLTDSDLASLPLPTAKTIDILAFVPADSIDPLQLDRSYYLAADGAGAAKPYVLLREALNRSEKVAIAKFALRGRETLGMVRVIGDSLAIHTMLWPDEIRPATGIAPETKVTVRDAELDLADTLMDALGSVDLASLHDDYREAVEALVAAKLEGTEPAQPGERPAGGKVIDLMAALESSVRAAREDRGEEGGGATARAEVTELPARKAARKPARKAADAAEGGQGGEGAVGGATKQTAAKRAAKRAATTATARKSTTGTSAKRSAEEPGQTRGRTGNGGTGSTAKKTAKKTAAKKSGRASA